MNRFNLVERGEISKSSQLEGLCLAIFFHGLINTNLAAIKAKTVPNMHKATLALNGKPSMYSRVSEIKSINFTFL